MKLLWITFAPVGKANELFYGRKTQSGGWVDATAAALQPYIKKDQVSLCITCMGDKDLCETDEETAIAYRMVNIRPVRGKRGERSDLEKWQNLIRETDPDLIQIWGTEFSFGLDVLDAAGRIPVCFYIQGAMGSVAAHPLGDIPAGKLARQLGLFSWPKLLQQKKAHKINDLQVAIEAEMVKRSAGILADNLWSQAQYGVSDDRFFPVSLAMNPCFMEAAWTAQNCQKHTLFTVAGGACPSKGVHNAVLAVAKLKEKYPDIRLHIPGYISRRKPNFWYDSLYIRQIEKLIGQYGLQENVIFVGSLTPQQMAEHMRRANVFVMPSCVETHSSTLREAMAAGTPCVSAMVGSVPEFLQHGKNGYLYRYDEAETLAFYIDRLFSDEALAAQLGAAGRETVRQMFPQEKIGQQLMDAYCAMINK